MVHGTLLSQLLNLYKNLIPLKPATLKDLQFLKRFGSETSHEFMILFPVRESLEVARSKPPQILRKKVNKQFLDGAHCNFSSVICNMQDKNLHPQKLQVKKGLCPFVLIQVKTGC